MKKRGEKGGEGEREEKRIRQKNSRLDRKSVTSKTLENNKLYNELNFHH